MNGETFLPEVDPLGRGPRVVGLAVVAVAVHVVDAIVTKGSAKEEIEENRFICSFDNGIPLYSKDLSS